MGLIDTGPTLAEVRAALSEGFCPHCRTALKPRKPNLPSGATSGFCTTCNTLWALTSGSVRMHWTKPAPLRPEWADLLGDAE